MALSKSSIIILGIIFIWSFALLNRLHVYRTSEVVPVKVYVSPYGYHFLFKYNNIDYTKYVDDDLYLKDNMDYRLLIKGNNPNDFTILTFWEFAFDTVIISIFITLVWLLFMKEYFSNRNRFRLSQKNNDEK